MDITLKVEKIKAEIERLYKEYRLGSSTEAKYRCEAYRELLDFANSLPAEPVSEDLELASERYSCRFSSSKYGYDKIKTAFKAGANWQEEQDNICYEEIFEEGAKWQNVQIMAKAVDGEVGYWNIRGLSVNMELPSKYKEGDKVKIIVIKED